MLWKDFNNEQVITHTTVLPDHSFNIEFYLHTPSVLSFRILGETAKINVHPGDSVKFEINADQKKPVITFSGTNSLRYNYDYQSDQYLLKNTGQYYPAINNSLKIDSFKTQLDEWLKYKMDFLNLFFQNSTVKQQDINNYRDEILYYYTYRLYKPVIAKWIKKEDLPANYFDIIDKYNFKQKNFISEMFLIASTYRYILSVNGSLSNNYDTIRRFIVNNYQGLQREYLLTNLTGVAFEKQAQFSNDSLLLQVKKTRAYVKDTFCLNYINRCSLDYALLNKNIPASISKNTFFIDFKSNSKISLEELFKRFDQKAIYVDFWANWCGACREDISHSSEAKAFLSNRNIAYIYISIDKLSDEEKWRTATLKDSISENQFLLIDGNNSPLAKFIKLGAIPRYLILNQDHKLKNYDAPRPTPEQFTTLKSAITEATGKAVTF
jgi:thiol-disulfide isomerase/thioredoxin